MLNFLRRVLLVVLGFVVVALITVLLLAPESISDVINDIGDISVFVRLLLVVLLYAGLLTVVYRWFLNMEQGGSKALIVKAPGAITEVSPESAAERILRTVRDLPDVKSASVDVKPVRGNAAVELKVIVEGDKVNILDKQKEINRAIEQVVKKQLGLRLAGRPHVHLSFGDEFKPLAPVGHEPKIESPASAAPPVSEAVAESVTEPASVEPAEPEIEEVAPTPELEKVTSNTELEEAHVSDEIAEVSSGDEKSAADPIDEAEVAEIKEDEEVSEPEFLSMLGSETENPTDETENTMWEDDQPVSDPASDDADADKAVLDIPASSDPPEEPPPSGSSGA